MTKEEAIKVLDQVRQWTDYPKEAFTMAIDALSQPSLPSNLDKAARKSAVAPFNFELDEEHIYEYPYLPIAEQKFKEGAKWDREQMMKGAMEGEISSVDVGDDSYVKSLKMSELQKAIRNYNVGDKVKIIIVKEDLL